MVLPAVSEDFVQFVWKFCLFDASKLKLSNGESLQIVHPGTQNFAGGPDFFNAKIHIGGTLWAGNVEIHLSVKQWKQHKHEMDAAYNNVILHVVYWNENTSIQLKNGREVPTISIGQLIFKHTLNKYRLLQSKSKQFIPCQQLIHEVDSFTFYSFYDALLVARLERKGKEIEEDLQFTTGDLDGAFLITLFKYFGAPQNKDAFALLARSFQLSQLKKQSISIVQLESFLFGCANLLFNQDDYANKLENEFRYIQKLYKIKVYCRADQWNFAGVRPANFPTIRIAQLAALLFKEERLFSKLLEMTDLKRIKQLFDIQLSTYWLEHYNFSNKSKKRTKKLSLAFIDKLIINVVVPFMFFYGQYVQDEKYIQRALSFLEKTKKENFKLVDKYEALGAPISSAMQTQALVELHNNYCQQKKCLDCRIAYAILNSD